MLLEGSVADLSKTVEENGPGQGVPGLAFVQPGCYGAAQVGILDPIQQEESSSQCAVMVLVLMVPPISGANVDNTGSLVGV